MQFNTRLLHAESSVPMMHGEILPPVSQVSAFRYDTMESLEQVFHHKRMGYAYTRIGNPTITALERKINELEGGAGAVCCSSGMAAITSAILAVCESGDEIIAGSGLYGGTIDSFLPGRFQRKGVPDYQRAEVCHDCQQYRRCQNAGHSSRFHAVSAYRPGRTGGCGCI